MEDICADNLWLCCIGDFSSMTVAFEDICLTFFLLIGGVGIALAVDFFKVILLVTFLIFCVAEVGACVTVAFFWIGIDTFMAADFLGTVAEGLNLGFSGHFF